MAAFQQRRQATARPPPIYSEPSSDNLAASLTPSHDDDEAVLLFSPPPQSSTLADSSWAVVPPPARAGRTISFTSDVSTTSRSTVSTGTTDSLGSPQQGGAGSLLPAHGGDGVFLPAESLAQSDLLLPSVYASAVDDPHPSSPSLASTASSSLPFSSQHARRPSVQSQISFASSFSGTSSSGGNSVDAWGPLTEENLAASSTGWGRHSSSNSRFADEARADDERSAGYTSGSEEEGQEREDGVRRRSTRVTGGREGDDTRRSATTAAEARAKELKARLDDAQWALSPAALSSGLFPTQPRATSRSSTRRRFPPSASFSQSSLPFSPARTSLSSATSGSGSVARYKRRHRRAGGRAGSAGSQKRASTDAGVVARVGRWDEEERAGRMREVLRVREREAEDKEVIRKVEEKVLFGHAMLSYFHIPPSHLALIASAPSTAYPTPTPSRSASPSRLHGLERFSAQATADARFSVGEAGLDADVSDAETEHPADSPDPADKWRSFSTTPPAASLRPRSPRKSSPPAASPPPPTRSRSAADLPGLGLTLHPLHPHNLDRPSLLMRRSSSFAGAPSSSAAIAGAEHGLSASTASASPARAQRPSLSEVGGIEGGRKLSHEERVLLGSPSSAETAADGEGAAWGGDLDSFELALSYWKGFLKRLGVYGGPGLGEAGEGEGEERAGKGPDSVPVVQVYA
ncbi:hypothetical protein JCM6882_005845 [Rhodosporidiobolus microsporus]